MLSITLMTLDHRTSYVHTLRSGIAVLVYPLQFVVDFPSTLFDVASDSFTSRKTLKVENEDLKRQIFILTAQLQDKNSVESENRHLRSLMQSSQRMEDRILIAELLSVDMDPQKQQVSLNRGSRHNAYRNQPIIDAKGVMGKLVHVNPITSTALLITDPSHALPVQVNRNGLRAVAKGTDNPARLEIPHLPNNADIKVGDLLVTSGLGCVFPVGYPAAEVVEINIDPSLPFAEVYAQPIAELDRSREVLLVWPGGQSKKDPDDPCMIDQGKESTDKPALEKAEQS